MREAETGLEKDRESERIRENISSKTHLDISENETKEGVKVGDKLERLLATQPGTGQVFVELPV